MIVLVGLVSAVLAGAMGVVLLFGPQRVATWRIFGRPPSGDAANGGAVGGGGAAGSGAIGGGAIGGTAAVPAQPSRISRWLNEAGLGNARLRDLLLACSTLSVGAFLAMLALFGGVLPAVLTAIGISGAPIALYRKRRQKHLQDAQEAWPRIIEEIRLLVTNSGKSIPAALFIAGARAPASLRDGFEAAEREWLLTTNFERSIAVLKVAFCHPTGDTIAETLLGAYAVGGIDLERRLRDLSDDRIADLTARKDARAKQAGARFARAFVLAVPAGMALMGLGIGRGREAYQTATGQVLVAVAVLTVMACWFWASRIMVLPDERRVFS